MQPSSPKLIAIPSDHLSRVHLTVSTYSGAAYCTVIEQFWTAYKNYLGIRKCMAWHRVKAYVGCWLILGQDVIADVDKLLTATAQMVLTPSPDDCLELRNLQHNAHFLGKRCQNLRQRVPKTALRRPVDHVTVGR